MSLIALILCIIFIFWLLRVEHKQNPSASWAVWIPTIWIIKITSKDLAYWIGRGDAEIGSGSPYERYLLVLLLCLGLIMLYKRRFDLYKAIKDNIWFIVLFVYMFLSIFWTEIPLITSFKRWVRELIAVIMVFVVLSEAEPRNAVESILRRSIYVLIPLSLLLVMFFPEYGTETFGSFEAWIGVTTHKNGLGRLTYIAIFFLIWALFNRRLVHNVLSTRYLSYIDVLMLGMALYLLKGPGVGKTISISSVITLAVGLGILFSLLLARRFRKYLGLNTLRATTVGIIVIGTASAFIGGLVVGGEIASSLGREETLTGRTQIWAELIPFAMREPIIGHGIDGFFTDEMKKSLGNLPHAHNGYLNIILDYGFVGLFLVSMFLLSLCGKAYKTLYYNYGWGSLLLCFLFMSAIYNVAEPSFDSFKSQQMAIILFLSVSSASISEYRPLITNETFSG
jgi:O-antigen ligase